MVVCLIAVAFARVACFAVAASLVGLVLFVVVLGSVFGSGVVVLAVVVVSPVAASW